MLKYKLKKNFNFLSLIILTILMQGCVYTQKSSLSQSQEVEQKVEISGAIKGVITSLSLSENGWIYEIEGVDMSNLKLPYIKAYSDKIYFAKDDFVYAFVENSKIVSMYLIEKSKDKYITNRKNMYRKMIIPVPKSENIKF